MLFSTVAHALIKKLICVFGAPRLVLTDQAKNFLSNLIKRIAKRFKIRRLKTTAFSPASNGSLERSYQPLAESLKQYVNCDSEWDEWLYLAMLNYNSCIHEGTKPTPFKVVFGRLPRLPSSEPLREGDVLPNYNDYVFDLVTRINGI